MKKYYRIFSTAILFTLSLILSGCITIIEPSSTESVNASVPNTEFESVVDVVPTSSNNLNDEFVKEVEGVISGSIAADELITDVVFANKELYIYIELGDPSPLTYDDLMIARTSSITDKVLSLSDYYDLWDTVIIDFGSNGSIKNNQSDMVDDGYGPYFPSGNFLIE